MPRLKEFQEEEVVQKAVELFWTKGYNAASMQDVVDYLGISRSSLYDTFGDKRKLFLLALQNYRSNMAGNLISAVNSGQNTFQTIKNIFEFIAGSCTNDSCAKGCFMVNTAIELAPHDKEIAQVLSENENQIKNAFITVLKYGQEKGEIAANHSPEAMANFFFNIISGMRVASRAGTDKKSFEDTITLALSVLK